MKLNSIIILLLFILLIPISYAFTLVDTTGAVVTDTTTETASTNAATDNDAYKWLSTNMGAASWDKSIQEISFAILALNNNGNYESDVITGLTKLLSKGSTNGCWPKNSCTIEDTAFALLALGKTGQNITDGAEWLKKTQIASGSKAGNWYIQVLSIVDGTCDVICEDGSTKKIEVGQKKSWVDAATLCGAIGNAKSKKYDVYCGDVGDPNIHISLLYSITHADFSETFLLQDEATQKTTLILENACFPKTPGSTTCDYQSTLYATWALKIVAGEELNTLSYLEENKNINPLHRAVLYLITGSEYYASWLKDHQKPSGSWADDVYTTSIAALSLVQSTADYDAYINATSWLNLKYNSKRTNWNDKLLDTASALIALTGEIKESYVDISGIGNIESVCDDTLDNDNDGLTDCEDTDCASSSACVCKEATAECNEDSDCETGKYCNLVTCMCDTSAVQEGCSKANNDECEIDSDCEPGKICDTFSCTCENPVTGEVEICDNGEDDDSDGDVDCDDSGCSDDAACKKGILPWIIALFGSLILLGIVAFYYINYAKKGKTFKDFSSDLGYIFSKIFKKKGKKPSFEEYVSAKQRPAAELIQSKPQQVKLPSYTTSKKPKEGKVEEELEKSLEEAKKLLGK